LKRREQPAAIVHRVLEEYARRGVFRSFSQVAPGRFRFYWLWNLPFELTLDEKRASLAFRGLLPKMTPELVAGIVEFLKECCSEDRPEHRRVEALRAAVSFSTRGTLTLYAISGDYEYAARKAINLVSELFTGYLSLHHPRYLASSFRIAEE
jgi:hypothetical protein